MKLYGVVHSEAIEARALEVLRSGQIASGPYVEAFRAKFGEIIGNPYVVTTNDMSNAMTIAFRLCGLGDEHEVITSPFSCLSSNAPVGTSGATTIWADIDPDTASLSPQSVERLITPRTRAVVLYHVAGYPGPAQRIAEICRAAGVTLIEDCNNALGATIDGASVGSFGDYAVYSFYPNRQINAVDGGAIACRTEREFARAMALRRYGIDSIRFRDQLGEIDASVDVPELGWAATLNNLSSAIGLEQLETLPERQTRTLRNAEWLRERLADIPGLDLVHPLPGAQPAYWTVLALCENRDEALTRLKRAGVHVSKMHHRNDTYSGFRTLPSELPGVTRFMDSTLSFPCGWWLERDDLDSIVSIVSDVFTDLA